MKLYTALVPSPLGPIRLLVREDGALAGLDFDESAAPTTAAQNGSGALPDLQRCAPAALAVADYFSGGRRLFGLPLAISGTAFQERVWAELCRIPYGETVSYAELARRIGAPRAVRAVARANAANRIAVAIPCHRVIAASGALAGYAAGIERKRQLLLLEGASRPDESSARASAPSRARTHPRSGDAVPVHAG